MSVSKTSKVNSRITRIAACILAAAAVIVLCLVFVVPFAKYNIAKSLVRKEQYDQAVQMLTSLDDYRDSRKLLSEVLMEHTEYMQEGMTLEFGQFEGEPIEWFVVFTEDDGVCLLSRYVLTSQPFDSDQDTDEWEDCSLREWLNGEFYNDSFTEEEKMRIEEGGDRVFLLDQSRVDQLPDDICVGTNRSGVPYYWWITSSDGCSLGPAFSERYIRDRAGSGGRGENGSNVLIGVRPAIWISPD